MKKIFLLFCSLICFYGFSTVSLADYTGEQTVYKYVKTSNFADTSFHSPNSFETWTMTCKDKMFLIKDSTDTPYVGRMMQFYSWNTETGNYNQNVELEPFSKIITYADNSPAKVFINSPQSWAPGQQKCTLTFVESWMTSNTNIPIFNSLSDAVLFFTKGDTSVITNLAPPSTFDDKSATLDTSIGYPKNVKRQVQAITADTGINNQMVYITYDNVIDPKVFVQVRLNCYYKESLFATKKYGFIEFLKPNSYSAAKDGYFYNLGEQVDALRKINGETLLSIPASYGGVKEEYVRFVKYVNNKWVYGQWVRFDVEDSLTEYPDSSVTAGTVGVSGNWVPDANTDYGTGTKLDGATGIPKTDLTGTGLTVDNFASGIKNVTSGIGSLFNMVGQVPAMLGALFVFLPKEIILLMCTSISLIMIIIVVRFLRG